MRHILVVEDEPLVYEAISIAFGLQGGFHLAYAGDGELALSLLARRDPDLAIIDVCLPKVSGLKVAEYAASRHVPVILMSGHPDTIADTIAISARHHFPILIKPFRISGLVDTVDQLLAESALSPGDLPEHVLAGQRLAQARPSVGTDDASEQWLRICERVLGNLSYRG